MYLKSPFNYMGNKYKLLDQILPIFPRKIDVLVDLFAGGFDVGLNVSADSYVYNDIIHFLPEMIQYLANIESKLLLNNIEKIIKKYNLDEEDSKYLELRKDYNETREPILLFVLTCYSFNHQIRFNNSHEFNVPSGKGRSSFNTSIRNRLVSFVDILKERRIKFLSIDFREVKFDNLTNDSLVYCDPPYLITTASYNNGKRGFKGWSQKDDDDLLKLLDRLNDNGIRFALSNVTHHKGKENTKLIEWSKKYYVFDLSMKYDNSYYTNKGSEVTKEVLITNFERGELHD